MSLLPKFIRRLPRPTHSLRFFSDTKQVKNESLSGLSDRPCALPDSDAHGNLSFTKQESFPLFWGGWRDSAVPLCLPGSHLGRAESERLLPGWLESSGPSRCPAAAEKHCFLGGVSFQGAGQGARESWPHRPPSPAGEAPQLGPAGSPHPWAAGCRRGESSGQRAQRGHPAAPDRGRPWLILHS